MSYYDDEYDPIIVGQRYRMHPASDWFMRGILYATVQAIDTKWVIMERDNGKTFRIYHTTFFNHVLELV